MSDKSQRTEKPTQRRIDKARQDGQFPVSREFLSALQFVAFLSLLIFSAPALLDLLFGMIRDSIRSAFTGEVSVRQLHEMAIDTALRFAGEFLWAGLAILLLTLLFQLMQTKFGFSSKSLIPNFKRVNPLQKAGNLWKQNGPETLKSLILLPVFCWIVYEIGKEQLPLYLQLPHMALSHGFHTATDSVRTLLWRAAAFFLVLGVVDLARVRQRYLQDLKMSRQEIRDELKEVEGHPMIRARIRRLQRERSRKQMLRDVASATAVLVNPTHFAVAIRYEPATMAAPRVVARGVDHLALRIRGIARDRGVPVIENPPLAQALYRNTKVGQEIPPELYRAVAEVLAYVFQTSRGRRR